jgi:glycosyltransferase involved in cell wall biosynthesis
MTDSFGSSNLKHSTFNFQPTTHNLQLALKILHIIKSLGRGGAEMLLPETIRLHNKERFQFHVIYFLPWKNQMVNELEEAGATVKCFAATNNIKILLQAKTVARYVKENKIDLIHCHLPWAGFLGRIVHRLTGVPVIYTEHNKQERYHKLTKWINRFTFNWQSAAIAVSGEVAESIQKNIEPNILVHTILNGVNTDKFKRSEEGRQKLRLQYGWDEDTIVIGTLAVFRFQKRLDLWLELFKKISEQNPDKKIKGVIVGAGPLKDQIEQKQKELNLEQDVLMPGLQTNTIDWFSSMDIYMMCSVFEGLPIALLEAMSCGLPVVTTNAGGIGEVIRHEVDGLLVPVDEPYKVVEEVGKMILNKSVRDQYAKAARERVVDAFGMERMVKELEGRYRLSVIG